KSFLERRVRKLLVVEDNEIERSEIVAQIGNGDVRTTGVGSAEEALTLLRQEEFDCLVLDLRLPDLPGRELIGKIKGELRRPDLPIIVYTGKDLTAEEEAWLRGMTQTIIAKDGRSLDQLLDKTALFLHRIQARLPEPVRHIVERGQKVEPRLAGKKI